MGNEGSERVINLPQVTQPVSDSRSKTQRQPCWPHFVSQKRSHVLHVSRQDDGLWNRTGYQGFGLSLGRVLAGVLGPILVQGQGSAMMAN